MVITLYTDGGSRGNPGEAAIAAIAYCNDCELFKKSMRIGWATNNIAEYKALLLGLETILSHIRHNTLAVTKIIAYSDSELMVAQINGIYKVKNPEIRECVMKLRLLEAELSGYTIIYMHVPREKNKEADALVNRAFEC